MSGTTARPTERPGLVARIDDRLNPILVREINQSLGGRVFPGTLHASVAAICLLCIVFFGASAYSEVSGVQLLYGCIMCLAPLIMIFAPMQAFSSTRQEVTGGTAEQLLMTRLRPSRIVAGKLSASLLQFVIYISVFAPVIAVTYLLNGVDAALVAFILTLALLVGILCVAFAVAMGSIGGSRHLQQLIQGVTTAALFTATFAVIGGAQFLPYTFGMLLRSSGFWPVFLSILLVFALAILLCCIVASTSLAHAYENRSSPFRAFAIAVQLAAIPWMFLALERSDLDDVPSYLSMGIAGFGAPFWLWACCEDHELSPRVRTLVPERTWLAYLATPFLPGGQRGFVFTLLMALIGMLTGVAVPWLAGVAPRGRVVEACIAAWCYVLMYAGLARVVRPRFRRGRAGSFITFVVVLLGSGILWTSIYVFDFIVDGNVRWHVLHVFDPFITIDHLWSGSGTVGALLTVAAVFAGLGALSSVPGAFREVGKASRARRKLAAGV